MFARVGVSTRCWDGYAIDVGKGKGIQSRLGLGEVGVYTRCWEGGAIHSMLQGCHMISNEDTDFEIQGVICERFWSHMF